MPLVAVRIRVCSLNVKIVQGGLSVTASLVIFNGVFFNEILSSALQSSSPPLILFLVATLVPNAAFQSPPQPPLLFSLTSSSLPVKISVNLQKPFLQLFIAQQRAT